MPQDWNQVAAQVSPMLEAAQGMTLVQATIEKTGFRFLYEGGGKRRVVTLSPRVYTDGAVIVDPINDLVVTLTVETFDAAQSAAAAAKPLETSTIELPFSTWFFQGNYR